MKVKLKSCPFCGGVVKVGKMPGGKTDATSFFVNCVNNECKMIVATPRYTHRKKAISLWNERV